METSVLGSRKTPERYNDYDDDGDLVDDGDLQEVGMEWLVAFSKMRRGSSSQKLQDGRRGGSSLPGKSALDVATDCFVQGERAGEMEAEKGRAAGSQAPISSRLTFSTKKKKLRSACFTFSRHKTFPGFQNKGSNGHGPTKVPMDIGHAPTKGPIEGPTKGLKRCPMDNWTNFNQLRVKYFPKRASLGFSRPR